MRARPARLAWQVNRHPLLEKRMTRSDCLQWLNEQGYSTPPKSACTFCPYRSDENWRLLKKSDPEGFQQAVEIDETIRNGGHMAIRRNKLFVHRSLKPLAEVEFKGQDEPDLFNNECEGMCGV